jgi:hypothetical protein
MDDQHAGHSPLRGWRGLLLVVAASLLTLVGGGCWWWFDTRDLATIRAKATELNIPLNWQQVGLHVSTKERLAAWGRIQVLLKRLDPYVNKLSIYPEKFTSFAPIPEAMRTYHAAMDPQDWRDLLFALDELGDQPLTLREHYALTTPVDEINHYRNLLRLLRERAALADPTEALSLTRRQLTICRGCASDTLIQHLIRISLVSIALGSVTDRLAEYRAVDPTLADEVVKTVESLPPSLTQSLIGEFVNQFAACADGTYAYQERGWYMPALVRVGRYQLLDSSLDFITAAKIGDLPTVLSRTKAHEMRLMKARSGIPTPTLILSGMVSSSYSYVASATWESVLKGRLLAAELRSQPWPLDVFDPAGKSLRPMERDGKIIGAYTVGKDGIDDGGDKNKDRYFPLYGPLEPPMPPSPSPVP